MLHLTTAYERAPTFATLQAMTVIDRKSKRVKLGLMHAMRRINAAVEKGQGGPSALLLRAEILTDLGEFDRAENDALRAFEAAPSLPGAVDLLIEIYRKQDKLAEAHKSFEEAEQAGVLHAGARRLLARLYAEQGKPADAIRMLEKVVDETPRMTGAQRDLAQLLAAEGKDLERALELARSANEKRAKDSRSASTLAFVYYRKGLYEAALREYQRAIKLDRNTGEHMAPSLFYQLGLTLQKLDRNERAAEAFESALAFSSDFPDAPNARRLLKTIGSS
jgi:tetratricopeptide (TPR) repeat protein